jgi:hypothetical protein
MDVHRRYVDRVLRQMRVGFRGQQEPGHHLRVRGHLHGQVQLPAIEQAGRECRELTQLGLEDTIDDADRGLGLTPQRNPASRHVVERERHAVQAHGVASRLQLEESLEWDRRGNPRLGEPNTGQQQERQCANGGAHGVAPSLRGLVPEPAVTRLRTRARNDHDIA